MLPVENKPARRTCHVGGANPADDRERGLGGQAILSKCSRYTSDGDRSSTFSRSAVPGTHGRWKVSRSKKPRTFGHESALANSLASLLPPGFTRRDDLVFASGAKPGTTGAQHPCSTDARS